MTEYIITTEQIKGITPYLLAEKKIPSWLACWALWDVSGAVPQRKDDGVAIGLQEIVRCGDCVHYKPWVLSRPENGGDCVLNKVEVDVWFDGFCAWGERREHA